MMHFTVNDYQAINNCQKCCCEKLNLKPGTVNKVSVGYAPWAVPIGQLHCTPQFQIEQMDTCPLPVGSNLPPTMTADVKFSTTVNATAREHADGDDQRSGGGDTDVQVVAVVRTEARQARSANPTARFPTRRPTIMSAKNGSMSRPATAATPASSRS